MNRFLGMCFNRNVLIGLAAVGLGLFVVAPNLAVAALPFLLLAVCPLSMVLMPQLMGRRGMQHTMQGAGANQGRSPESTADLPNPPAERLSEVQTHLMQLQEQQAAILEQIAELEQTERDRTTQKVLKE